MSEFLAMGGYAQFVWPSYGLAVLVLGGFALWVRLRARARARELAALQASVEARRQ